jgi:hypothetical protein
MNSITNFLTRLLAGHTGKHKGRRLVLFVTNAEMLKCIGISRMNNGDAKHAKPQPLFAKEL